MIVKNKGLITVLVLKFVLMFQKGPLKIWSINLSFNFQK